MLLRPAAIYGKPRQPGDIVHTHCLAFALALMRAGTAEPGDAWTSREIELAVLLQHAIPRRVQ